jgi:hypothetical protein
VWQRGLVRKGLGLCHGICGNGYAFLSAYRATHDESYLQKALAFAHFASKVCAIAIASHWTACAVSSVHVRQALGYVYALLECPQLSSSSPISSLCFATMACMQLPHMTRIENNVCADIGSSLAPANNAPRRLPKRRPNQLVLATGAVHTASIKLCTLLHLVLHALSDLGSQDGPRFLHTYVMSRPLVLLKEETSNPDTIAQPTCVPAMSRQNHVRCRSPRRSSHYQRGRCPCTRVLLGLSAIGQTC